MESGPGETPGPLSCWNLSPTTFVIYRGFTGEPAVPFPSWPSWLRMRTAWYAVAATFAIGALAIGSEALVRARLDSSLESGTARFYARAPQFQLNGYLDQSTLQAYLDRMSYQRVESRLVGRGQYRRNGDGWTIGRRPLRVAGQDVGGGPLTIRVGDDHRVAALGDSSGQALDTAALEPEALRTPAGPDGDRVPVSLAEVPAHL